MTSASCDLEDLDAIIFDLGGVILNLEYERTITEFKKDLPALDASVFYGKEAQLPFYSEYEIGRISTADLVSRFNVHHGSSFSGDLFKTCWNAMILDFPPRRIALLQRLRASGKRVFLLSNINELHDLAVEESYARLGHPEKFHDLFDKVYYSYQVGRRKPNADIFELVLSENRLRPDRCLFIDDSAHHVLGAKKTGLHAVHLQKPETILDLPVFKVLQK
ncbi:MAG: hypothetical protein A2X30_00365 [Elusimicrobia bacterium GWB2_63_16]|nr:MAG: hypothetical protein A2X30_00365 [Elusimicrobia bacterium GWB2_63_16]